MDDLISRKALLAEYDRVHIGEPGKARKLIEDAPAVQQWISADNHPKEAGEYNVQIKGAEVATTLFYSIISKKWYEFLDDEHEHPYEITHWMPLPQPPKGE